MFIAKVSVVGEFDVRWFLLDRATAQHLFHLDQPPGTKRATRWGVVCADLSLHGKHYVADALASKKDEFMVGEGMRLSLTRALMDALPDDQCVTARKGVWDAVAADPIASNLIRSEEAQREWAKITSETLIRRAHSLYRPEPDREGQLAEDIDDFLRIIGGEVVSRRISNS